jgi:hypothetical protein
MEDSFALLYRGPAEYYQLVFSNAHGQSWLTDLGNS